MGIYPAKNTLLYPSEIRKAGPQLIKSLNNDGFSTLQVILDLTDMEGGSDTLVVNIYGGNSNSPSKYNILTSVSITAVGIYVFEIGPGLPSIAGESANRVVPQKVFVEVVHTGSNGVKYSVTGWWN